MTPRPPSVRLRLLIAATLTAASLLGQTAPPTFAVASVKRNTSIKNGIGNKFGPDNAHWMNAPLEFLIESVYRLKHYQIIGAPAWVGTDRWDIDAKSDGPVERQQAFEMLGTLLADRFQLRFHRETREMPVYQITIAKGGHKLADAKPQSPDHRWGTRVNRGLLEMSGTDMRNLVFWLSSQLDEPVEDHTGLTGTYDLKLEWNQDDRPPGATGDPTLANADLPISSAMEAELGLKLVAVKGPVEVLVIDHVERASGN